MDATPMAYVENFSKIIDTLSGDAQDKIRKALKQVEINDIATARNEIIAIMDAVLGPYTDNAASVAAEFYDGLRKRAGVRGNFEAEAESLRVPQATEGAVRAFMETQVKGKPREVLDKLLLERADYEIKRASNECVAYNARKDPSKPKWARVPTGPHTCQFCIMLASRGFAYQSEETASHAHADCNCRIVPGWGKNPKVEGYDPELYYDMYKNPDKYENQERQLEEPLQQGGNSSNIDEMKKAVEYYASGEGMYVNQFLRRGQYNELSDDEKELVKLLDEATKMDEVKANSLFRSVDASSIFGNMSQLQYEQLTEYLVYGDEYYAGQVSKFMERSKPGTLITERGFMSTSELYDVVSGWYDFTGSDKPITLELSVPKGLRGCNVYELTPEVEARDPQREVLLPRGTKYKIVEITSKDGLIYVIADIIA